MLDFRSNSKTRNYLARRAQWRLLLLAMLLGFVALATLEARHSEHYTWLFGAGVRGGTGPAEGRARGDAGPVDTRLSVDRPGNELPDAFISPREPHSEDGQPSRYFRGVNAAYLSTIRDDRPFRSAERDAWFHLFAILDKTEDAVLQAASTGRATFIQLLRQSDAYRGELVTIRGTIVRAHRLDAPENDYGIGAYYQTWIRPADNQHFPMVAYVLRLPQGFPLGMEVEEEAEMTGFFFKRWAYLAQDTVRTAPVVLARTIRWQAGPVENQAETGTMSAWTMIAAAAFFALFAAWFIHGRWGRRPSRRIERPGVLLALILPVGAAAGFFAAEAFAAGNRVSTAGNQAITAGNRASATGNQESTEETSVRPLAGPRGLFALRGIDASQFNRLIDGRPWQEDENEILLRMLYWIGRDFSWIDIDRWSRGAFPLSEATRDPATFRGELFHLSGRLQRVEILQATALATSRLGFDRYYRCEILLDESPSPAVIFTDTVPKRWSTDEPAAGPLDEPVGAFGFFLKLGGDDARRPVPVFAAGRVAWYPKTPLGKLGMDVGLLDGRLESLRLTAADRECFYRMLAAVGRAKPGWLAAEAQSELRRTGKDQFSVVPLFLKPHQQQGRLVVLSGRARRVTRVRVEEDDIRARFGIDHYYQLYLFTGDSQDNPLVFCVRELPPGMPTGGGPEFGEEVTVAGFFLKTWGYRIGESASGNQSRQDWQPGRDWQPAPLLIGRAPIWQPAAAPSENSLFGLTAGVAFLAVLLTLWLILRQLGRRDRRFRERMITGKSAPQWHGLPQRPNVRPDESDSDRAP